MKSPPPRARRKLYTVEDRYDQLEEDPRSQLFWAVVLFALFGALLFLLFSINFGPVERDGIYTPQTGTTTTAVKP